jgi:hypothetical protein
MLVVIREEWIDEGGVFTPETCLNFGRVVMSKVEHHRFGIDLVFEDVAMSKR